MVVEKALPRRVAQAGGADEEHALSPLAIVADDLAGRVGLSEPHAVGDHHVREAFARVEPGAEVQVLAATDLHVDRPVAVAHHDVADVEKLHDAQGRLLQHGVRVGAAPATRAAWARAIGLPRVPRRSVGAVTRSAYDPARGGPRRPGRRTTASASPRGRAP